MLQLRYIYIYIYMKFLRIYLTVYYIFAYNEYIWLNWIFTVFEYNNYFNFKYGHRKSWQTTNIYKLIICMNPGNRGWKWWALVSRGYHYCSLNILMLTCAQRNMPNCPTRPVWSYWAYWSYWTTANEKQRRWSCVQELCQILCIEYYGESYRSPN